MQIKALSLWQPWASLIAFGEKQIETRSWPCKLTMPCVIAIHAAKKWDMALYVECRCSPYRQALDRHGVTYDASDSRKLQRPSFPLGAIVCLARLVNCYGTESLNRLDIVSSKERAFGNYGRERFGWIFDNVLEVPPVAVKGGQGLWDWEVPVELERFVEALR